jgi:large exoprotein involved in heme utilization and adhesion
MGRVTISAPALSMLDGGTILTGTTNAGRAGDVAVQVGRLTLTGGADISSHTFSGGPGGTVTVTATDAVTISGQGRDGLPSNPSSTATGRGDAGRVAIVTPTLNLDGGRIAMATTGEGRAGDIAVEVGRLTLTGGAVIDSSTFVSGQGGTVTASDVVSLAGRNSGLFTRTAGSGPGGAIELRAQQVQLRDGGTISASSTGAGDAGTIRLQVGESFRSQNGAVTTATEGAGGGAIALTAGRLVQLQESDVTTSVRGGGGDAGNLTLDAPFIVADGSHIIANAFGGRGGNIRIGAEVFLADPASLVSASSELGISGTVDIQAPVTSLGGTLAALPQAFVNVAALLPARCAARWRGGKTSSLVLGGRDSLPLEPSGVLPSPLVLEERLATDPAGIGAPPQLPSPARFAFPADQEKALPRLQGSQPTTGCTK